MKNNKNMDRNYQNAKQIAREVENGAVKLDLLTLEGPKLKNGPDYLTRKQAQLLLKQVNDAKFNIGLVEQNLLNYINKK